MAPKANLVPRALFPGFGGPKAREKRPGDEVGLKHGQSRLNWNHGKSETDHDLLIMLIIIIIIIIIMIMIMIMIMIVLVIRTTTTLIIFMHFQ